MKKLFLFLLAALSFSASAQPILRNFATTNTAPVLTNIIIGMTQSPTGGVTALQVTNMIINNAVLKQDGFGNATILTNPSVSGTLYTDRIEATNSSTLSINGGGAELQLTSGTISAATAPGGFSGLGVNLTGLNASQLTSGTVPEARLSLPVAVSNLVNQTSNYYVGTLTSAFSPTNIANLAMWLDVGTLTGAANGQVITNWYGRAGFGLATNTSALGPIYRTAKLNGFDALTFYGTNRLVTTNIFGSGYNTAFTFFCVYQATNKPPGLQIIAGINGNTWRLYRGSTIGSVDDVNYYTSALTPNASPTLKVPWSLATNTVTATSFCYDGRTRIMGAGNYELMGTATNNLGTTGAMTLGDFSSGGFAWFGDLVEVLVYNRALTTSERKQVMNYVTLKWRIVQPPSLVAFDGNSLVAGSGVAADFSLAAQATNVLYPGRFLNFSASGYTTTQLFPHVGLIYDHYSPLRPDNIVPVWEITNDIVYGTNGTDSVNLMATYCRLVRSNGFKVVAFSCLPRIQFTNGVLETERQVANAWMRFNWRTFADGFVDAAGVTGMGEWYSYTNLSYYQSDGIHISANGASIVANLLGNEMRKIASTNLFVP